MLPGVSCWRTASHLNSHAPRPPFGNHWVHAADLSLAEGNLTNFKTRPGFHPKQNKRSGRTRGRIPHGADERDGTGP